MVRSADSPETRDLARRLLAYEEAAVSLVKADMPAVFRVCDKLRRPLTTLAGTAGYRSLLARALTLAKHEAPLLAAVQVREDGSLHGMGGESSQVGIVLISHLVGLMITFIGETLTMSLVREIWPDLPGPATNSGEKKTT